MRTPAIVDHLYTALLDHGDWMTTAEVAAATNLSHAYVGRTIGHLHDEGRIERAGGGRTGYRWRITTTTQGE